jgi:hypothetical protein
VTIEQIIVSWKPRVVDDAIFFRPAIPQNKLNGALGKYARDVPQDQVLVLVDNTVFGGAGDGMLITPTLFIGRDMGESPVRVQIDHVRDVRLDAGLMSRKVLFNGGQLLVTLNCPGHSGSVQLVEMMRAIIQGAMAQTAPSPPVQPTRPVATNCSSCGAPIPPAEAACVYCGRARH